MAELSFEQGLKALNTRTLIVRVGLVFYLVSTAVMTMLWADVVYSNIDQSGEFQDPILTMAGYASLAMVASFLFSVVAVCFWVYRAHANLFAAGFEGLEFTPGWSVGWFFVPVAFWFKPFQAMRELWNYSHYGDAGSHAAADVQLSAWWTCWVITNIVSNISMRLNGFGGAVTMFDVIGYSFAFGAAYLLLLIVNRISRAQERELTMQYAFA